MFPGTGAGAAMAFMKSGVTLLAALAVGVAYAVSDDGSRQAAGPASAANSFHVLLEGAETGCEVTMDEAPEAVRLRLVLGQSCAEAVPALAGARFWSARADGSIAFTDGDGRIALLFSAGDGVDYEAFGPGIPLVSLVSAVN